MYVYAGVECMCICVIVYVYTPCDAMNESWCNTRIGESRVEVCKCSVCTHIYQL